MKKYKILTVDDSEFNRTLLKKTLEDEYDVIEASNGLEAISIINKNSASISLILLDIMMPELNGIEVLKILKSTGITASTPVILITAADSNEEYSLQLGAVDFITKPFDPKIVKARVDTQMELKKARDSLEELVAINLNQTESMWSNTIEVMANVMEFRSLQYLNGYDKIKKITSMLIDKMIDNNVYTRQLSLLDRNVLLSAATLCDIGKIFIPENILYKTTKLSDKEFEIVKKHTVNGKILIGKCLSNLSESYVSCCQDVCLCHHENWDGSGYPNGIEGQDIPLSARIISITDVYDALVNGRPHRKAFTHNEAMDKIEEGSNTKFDPLIVDCFVDIEFEARKIYDI